MPMSEDDKLNMKYKAEKCLKALGFTKAENVRTVVILKFCVNLSNFFISCFKKSHWMFERGIRTRKIIHITCVTKCCFIWVDLGSFCDNLYVT